MEKKQNYWVQAALQPLPNLMKYFIYSLVLVVFLGCQKESISPSREIQQSKNTSSAGSEKSIDIIVHSGSSIQTAVNGASPGDVIGIEPGVYKEAILVSKPNIKLIGLPSKKGAVIIQNPGGMQNGITVTDEGDGFSLDNLTVKGFGENGVYLTHVNGFSISHVHAINNGAYGIFPVFSSNGIIEYCTATGHDDTGIYVGQSSDVKLRFNTAFANVNGLEIENSSNISVINNQSFDNVAGILIVLLPGLDVSVSSNIHVNQNLIYNNNHVNFASPGELESFVPSGSGILVVGTDQTEVKGNIVLRNNFVGIAVVSTVILGSLAGLPPEAFAGIEPNPDGTRIQKNILLRNGEAPPALPLPGVDLLWDGSGQNNCWSENIFKSSYPSPLPGCH